MIVIRCRTRRFAWALFSLSSPGSCLHPLLIPTTRQAVSGFLRSRIRQWAESQSLDSKVCAEVHCSDQSSSCYQALCISRKAPHDTSKQMRFSCSLPLLSFPTGNSHPLRDNVWNGGNWPSRDLGSIPVNPTQRVTQIVRFISVLFGSFLCKMTVTPGDLLYVTSGVKISLEASLPLIHARVQRPCEVQAPSCAGPCQPTHCHGHLTPNSDPPRPLSHSLLVNYWHLKSSFFRTLLGPCTIVLFNSFEE